jgi:hypothetical protein
MIQVMYEPSSTDRKDKLIHSSFRIKESILDALSVVAEKRGVSLSNIVSNTLENYVTSEMYFEERGFLLISKDFLRIIFSKLNQNQIEEFGKQLGIAVAREYVSYFVAEVNQDTLLEFLELFFRRFQSYQHRIDVRSHHFSVNHDIHMNFSITIKTILQDLIEPIIRSPVKFNEITSMSISFSFEI